MPPVKGTGTWSFYWPGLFSPVFLSDLGRLIARRLPPLAARSLPTDQNILPTMRDEERYSSSRPLKEFHGNEDDYPDWETDFETWSEWQWICLFVLFLYLACLCMPKCAEASCGIRLLSKVFGQNCSKTPNMGWIVDWRGWEGPEVPGMEVRFFPMAARSTVRGSQLEGD